VPDPEDYIAVAQDGVIAGRPPMEMK
jgi:hypothetical protein